MSAPAAVLGSFRDPDGFVFERDGTIYRQINQTGREDYDRLMSSGLHAELVEASLVIPHREAAVPAADPARAYKVLEPTRIGFVSYPYEWSFRQLQDAARVTLEIQKRALAHGLSLKDASAYNIQFHHGRPLLIDTSSFEALAPDRPWVAYRQFCQHFLAPLALMSLKDVRLSQLSRVHLDGVPLDLASVLLPGSTRWKPTLLTHLHLHARWQERHGATPVNVRPVAVSQASRLGLVDHLASAVSGLRWTPEKTVWGDYYDDTNYSASAFEDKRRRIGALIDRLRPASVWDLGGNVGVFSRLASERGIPTVCFDMDPAAVEKNYVEVVAKQEKNLLPLVLDLANPSPSLGWMNQERLSLIERGPADLALALALIHHLAIANHLPFPRIADFMAAVARRVIVEFVPREDSQVQRLLALRPDAFPDYGAAAFEAGFSERFQVLERLPVEGSGRVLYLLERRS